MNIGASADCMDFGGPIFISYTGRPGCMTVKTSKGRSLVLLFFKARSAGVKLFPGSSGKTGEIGHHSVLQSSQASQSHLHQQTLEILVETVETVDIVDIIVI